MEFPSQDSLQHNLPTLLERFIAEWNATSAIPAGHGDTLKWTKFFDNWRELAAQKVRGAKWRAAGFTQVGRGTG